MGRDGAADAAGAVGRVVEALERLLDEAFLLGGVRAGVEDANIGAGVLLQVGDAVGHDVGNDALGAAALLDELDLAALPLGRHSQTDVEHLGKVAR